MIGYVVVVFFFFSSRRRHTRFDCDWSSDVCSSDLALNTPDWSLVTRIECSSGEKEAPNMAVVFMNCSIVYWRTGRAGRALCAAAVPAIMLASARSGRVRHRYEGGRRTGRSGGRRSNLAVFRPACRFPIIADLL